MYEIWKRRSNFWTTPSDTDPGQAHCIDYPEVIGMVLLQDGILAFLSAVGLTTVVWLVAGAFLHAGRPTIPGLLLVLPLRGEAPAMEADVRALRRLQSRLLGAKIVLADRGMTPEARSLAAYLAQREPDIELAEHGTDFF